MTQKLLAENKKDVSQDNFSAQEAAIFSVRTLSMALKATLEETFYSIRVRGEVSSLKCHTSGHVYFTLKEEDAILDAVSWRGSQPAMSLSSSKGIRLEEGLEVIAKGRITIYPGRSKYQMVVESFEPTGQGTLLKLLEERKQKLAAEGLFTRKKPLPFLPQCIGVITSPTGAVIQDILHRLQDRFPCHVIVYPVLVQGPEAAAQVSKAVCDFQTLSSPRPDLLIVARGGGSLEDLWAFNEEIVVRAVAGSTIPTISAVGHETDTTLVDYASDRRAPTPTAAAEMAVPVLKDLLSNIDVLEHRMVQAFSKIIKHKFLEVQAKNLRHPRFILEDKVQRLDEWGERHHYAVFSRLRHYNQIFLTVKVPVPQCVVQEHSLQNLFENMTYQAQRILGSYQGKLGFLQATLEATSYQKTLQRGFCLAAKKNGKPITFSKDVPANDAFSLVFQDGSLPVVRSAKGQS